MIREDIKTVATELEGIQMVHPLPAERRVAGTASTMVGLSRHANKLQFADGKRSGSGLLLCPSTWSLDSQCHRVGFTHDRHVS